MKVFPTLKMFFTGIAVLSGLILLAPRAEAQNYNLENSFQAVASATSTDTVWTYGYIPGGGTYTLFDNTNLFPGGGGSSLGPNEAGYDFGPSTYYDPALWANLGGSNGNIGGTIPAVPSAVTDALMFHPGQLGEITTAQFTAPTAGVYDISAAFVSGSSVPNTTTLGSVYVNGTLVGSQAVTGAEPGYGPTGLAGSVTDNNVYLAKGAKVDIEVAANGQTFYNTTLVSADISVAPEPSTIAAFALTGFAVLALAGLRRKSGNLNSLAF